MKVLKTAILLACLGAIPCLAVDQPVGPFGGLNTNTAPEAIGATQSSDLLNVDVSAGGVSVKKRQGYGLDVTLNISTSPAHNLYKFFDSGGNEIRLAFNDFKVNSSVNGAAWTVILTTGVTLGSTWDCTDYLGFAYCVSSAFDCPIKTNGTSAGTTGVCGTNLVPAGTLISNSGDRLLIGATSANPSRLYYSASTLFTDFSLGIQSSNSSFEDIVAPGSKLTHLAYRFGRWLWWKDQSFGFIVGTGQFDLQIVTVSNTIGTLDNTDVFDGTLCYFRGSDAQIYTYDGSSLRRTISTDIAPSLRAANRRKANTWVQTTQSDFQAGISTPTTALSFTNSPGNVILSTTVLTDTLSNNQTIPDNSFENTSPLGWTYTASWVQSTSRTGSDCTISPQNGTRFASFDRICGPNWQTTKVLVTGSGCTFSQDLVTSQCSWTLNTAVLPSNCLGLPVIVKFRQSSSPSTDNDIISTGTYFAANNFTFYANTDIYATGNGGCPTGQYIAVDNLSGGFNLQVNTTTLAYQSPVLNLGASQKFLVNAFISSSTNKPTFSINSSPTGTGSWTALGVSTSAIFSSTGQYLQYISTMTNNSYLSSVSFQFSTATYYSAVNNAPNLTSFNTFGVTDSVNGNSSITYFTRSSTSPFYVTNSTPSWIAQTKNATVSTSSGTYFQLRADFAITAATETPTLNDFSFNWFEGVAADRMYGTYFNSAIWFSLSLGTSTSTNNRIFRYDLLANLWTLYDISANGFLTYNNNLYFGSPTTGKVFQFGNNVYSDNGTAITAYWKSKPFFGDSPFTEKELRTASWYVESDSGTTLNLTYELNRTTNTVTKNINLYDSRRGVIQNNWYFPTGTAATVFSAKFGDASSNPPWEVFGGLISFVPKPWIVSP